MAIEDLSRARTLASHYYLDPGVLDRERTRIFHRTWQWVGKAQDMREPGEYVCCEVAGEPLIIARDHDRALRAFSNVCRHRAGPVAVGSGCRKQLQCQYHGWSYGLDGRLVKAPEMDGVEDFQVADIQLPGVSCTEWSPLVFVNLDPTADTLDEVMGDIRAEVEEAGFQVGEMTSVKRREYFVESNWKVYVDNFLEGYHIPHVHPGLFREVDYDRYRVDTFRNYSSQHAPLRPMANNAAGRRYVPKTDSEKALHYWVYPNLMLNFYPKNLQVNLVVPLSVERTLVIFEWFAAKGELTAALESAIELGDEVQQEDASICQAVQRGLRSRTYDRGRYSVRRENGVHDFHRLYEESQVDSGADGI